MNGCPQECFPELTGLSKNPAGCWENRKLFSAGNRLSSNAVTIKGKFNREDIGALYLDEQFDLVPKNAETTAEGYFNDIPSSPGSKYYQFSQVWYGPTATEKDFYYTTYYGSSLFTQNSLSTILVSKPRCNPVQTNWAINTKNLYSGTGIVPRISICRTAPSIYKDTLYIGDCIYQPGGPFIFAV